MKRFNKQIEISFSVDTVAEMLLAKIDTSFPHKELLVENIIAPMVVNGNSGDSKRLGSIISALFGVKKELDFNVGDRMFCTDTYYANNEYHKKGSCTILEVEPHKDGDEIKIEYKRLQRDGEYKTDTSWVSPTTLQTMSVDPETGISTVNEAVAKF